MRSLSTELLILVLLVLANGILAMAETAVVSARRTGSRSSAEEGASGAARALALASNRPGFSPWCNFG